MSDIKFTWETLKVSIEILCAHVVEIKQPYYTQRRDTRPSRSKTQLEITFVRRAGAINERFFPKCIARSGTGKNCDVCHFTAYDANT